MDDALPHPAMATRGDSGWRDVEPAGDNELPRHDDDQPASYWADPGLLRRYRHWAVWAGIGVIAIGAQGLIGWFTEMPVLTSLNPQWVAMKANTAVGLIASGSGLFLCISKRKFARPSALLCSAFAALLGLATLAEYVSGLSFGIDQLLVAEPAGAAWTIYPGRMALVTAVAFIFCGAALLQLCARQQRWSWLSDALALPPLFACAIALLGYILGANELYTFAGNLTAIAAPTAVAFVLLSCGIILVRLEHSLLRWLASPHAGGFMLRRLMPLVILLPVVVVWLRLVGQAGGLFGSTEFGAATVAVAMMISMSAALLWCAALLDRLDRSGQRRGQQILKLNAALDDRLRALEVANKELEGFSYATSHVLQTPLRAIDGFSQVLLDDYSAKLDDEGRRLLGIVRTNARQMGGLIDEILGFLRLGRDEMHVRTVDMRLAVQAALKELEPQTRGRKIDIQVPALPTAYGDPTMIHRVWVNLLDNAVKFSATRAEPSIQVGAVTGNNEDVYYVRDNGVGFDEQFRAKLFGVFNRLHGEEFTGNGMGLAIVQRVMMRHGGRVWAEGKLGEGATFYFSLPRKVRDHG